MELDDLKNTWKDIDNQLKKQQNLNPKMIDQMTKTKYYSSLKKIAYSEIIGVIICLAGAAYVLVNFSKLNTTFLQGAGIISILLLLTLSGVSLISLRQFNMKENVNEPYAATLKVFAIKKIRFHKFQRINITLSYLLLVTTIILLSKFFGGNDITDSKYFWVFSFSFGYIFLLFYSKWVMKYYNKTLRQTEELLLELQS
jgi:phosphatidylserine synthase